VLVVASKANAPASHSEPVLGRRDVDQEHHVTLPGPREVLYRVNHAALHGPVEPLQVSAGGR
jgi:hypothetical protein